MIFPKEHKLVRSHAQKYDLDLDLSLLSISRLKIFCRLRIQRVEVWLIFEKTFPNICFLTNLFREICP